MLKNCWCQQNLISYRVNQEKSGSSDITSSNGKTNSLLNSDDSCGTIPVESLVTSRLCWLERIDDSDQIDIVSWV